MSASALLVTLSGRDRAGITSRFCSALAGEGCRILDMEQVVIREQLTLGILIDVDGDPSQLRTRLASLAADLDLAARFTHVDEREPAAAVVRHCVTVLGQPLQARALAGVTRSIAEAGANIDRIARLSRYPVQSFELVVSGGDRDRLRAGLAEEAARQQVDVAVQRADLYRRAKRLICFDVDSTLITGEVIELLARHAGCAEEVGAITDAAMAGDLDFETSLRRRVALLEGLPHQALAQVRGHLQLTPGARTVVRTLRRLGFTLAIVSGGFSEITDSLKTELALDFAAANRLEVVDGRLTGRLVGTIVDRASKAELLSDFARRAGVPINQTVAVGDGANDLDMLNRAGLGIAFNAKPAVQAAADTVVSVPYLDAILFLLGITREEIETADAEDPEFQVVARPPVGDLGGLPQGR